MEPNGVVIVDSDVDGDAAAQKKISCEKLLEHKWLQCLKQKKSGCEPGHDCFREG